MENTNLIIIASISIIFFIILYYIMSKKSETFQVLAPSVQKQPWTQQQIDNISELWVMFIRMTGIGCTNINGEQEPNIVNCITPKVVNLLSQYYDYEIIKNAILSEGYNVNVDIFGYFPREIKMQIKSIFDQCASLNNCNLFLPALMYVENMFT